MKKELGIFYGIGVGPGDPELMTVKAAKILGELDIVFSAASTKNDYSVAYEIAKAYIPLTAEVIPLPFKMTTHQATRQQARQRNAKTVLRVLNQGKDAAFLTLGDPLTYSTFSYLAKTLAGLEPNITIKTIPGITSYQAAASRLMIPLVEGEESLLVLSGTQGGEALRKAVGKADNIVMLKTYKNFDHILATLEELNLVDHTIGISQCGLAGEEIITDIRRYKDHHPPYFTLLLIKSEGKRLKVEG